MLSEESKNVVHSIETEFESLLHGNFPADLVTERSRLVKGGEKTTQILEKRRKHKWKKFTRINKNSRTRTLNILIASNLLIFHTEKKENF